ncbi:hypothetical protein AGMMS50276_19360 [Synergistales bacterium]|nr:hypothetical protein AGMMS50276_19360 [Synergistales bacterium]
MSLKDEYLPLFRKSAQRASDYTFINIWGWSEERGYELAFQDGLCWLRLNGPFSAPFAEPVMWAPVGDWERPDWEEVLIRTFPSGATFERVPEKLAEIWRAELGKRVTLSEARSEWEYLYSYEKMVSLSGNKMHKKKNLLTQFMKLYKYEYSDMDIDHLQSILAAQDAWLKRRADADSRGLVSENIAISRVLGQWESLSGVLGGFISVEGQIIAYTVAEDLGDGTVVIHFEKGMETYKGVYQAINQMFLSHLIVPFTTVNREQDMGSDGVRQAKESYNPTGHIKKYCVRWAGEGA